MNKDRFEYKHRMKSVDDVFEQFDFWVIAYTVQDGKFLTVHHTVGYESRPSETDLDALRKELRGDPDLGCRDVANIVSFAVVSPYFAKKLLRI